MSGSSLIILIGVGVFAGYLARLLYIRGEIEASRDVFIDLSELFYPGWVQGFLYDGTEVHVKTGSKVGFKVGGNTYFIASTPVGELRVEMEIEDYHGPDAVLVNWNDDEVKPLRKAFKKLNHNFTLIPSQDGL